MKRAARPQGRPRWYVSLRSPYSWLALHDAKLAHPAFLEACEQLVFYEPDPAGHAALALRDAALPYVAMSRAKHLYILRDVARLAAARGLRPTWPQDRSPTWEVPSLAVLAARAVDPAAGRLLAQRLTTARWQDGLDICAPDVVAQCARECRLDPDLSRSAESPLWREAGWDELQQVHLDGVFGVPYFVVGREPFWGLDRLGAAAAAWKVLAERDSVTDHRDSSGEAAEQPVLAGAGAEQGHAGGCG